jgi:cobalt-precorrin 5A hydrolase
MNTSIALFSITELGYKIGLKIAEELNADLYIFHRVNCCWETRVRTMTFSSLSIKLREVFFKYKGLIFVMSTGIVTRVIAPLLRDKHNDPAVVVHDEMGRFCISLLSGHEGGANELCYQVSSITGADPVVTTASEANRVYICGIGYKKEATKDTLIRAIIEGCNLIGISPEDLRCLASGWLKQNEQTLKETAKELGTYIRFIPKWLIQDFYKKNPSLHRSERVKRLTGVYGIAEPCALLSGKNTELVLKRKVIGGVTVAIAREGLR